MIKYPTNFQSSAKTVSGIQTKWASLASENQIECSIPQEFEGPGGAFSPEDLYLLAIQNCFIGTFKVFAEHSKVQYTGVEITSRLIVDKDEKSRPWMDSVHMEININGVTDEKRVRLIVNKTLENGFILRSVKTKITTEINIQ